MLCEALEAQGVEFIRRAAGEPGFGFISTFLNPVCGTSYGGGKMASLSEEVQQPACGGDSATVRLPILPPSGSRRDDLNLVAVGVVDIHAL